MSTFISTKQESFLEKNYTTGPISRQYVSYTTEPNVLREDFAVKKVERPEAYQFWHKKEKYNSYASRVLNTNYKTTSIINLGQQYQVNNFGQQSQIVNNDQNDEFQCCTKQQMIVSVVIASREQIEQPWREECLYLQSVIKELEKKKQVQVVKEIDYARIHELEDENQRLQIELQSAQEQTLITERVVQTSGEVDVWKRKYNEATKNLQETDEKYHLIITELEALRKEKAKQQQQSSTTVTRSTVRTGTSNVRQSGQL